MADDEKPDTSEAWTPEQSRRAALRFTLLDNITEFVETFEGMAQGLIRNGWTDEQARAIVAYQFGWRPADGTIPEGGER